MEDPISSPLTPNRRRILSDVISLEAWHEPFSPGRVSAIYVDAVFLEARLGKEPESPVRFTLKLRRAEIALVISPNEPLQVLHASVARDQSVKSARLKSQKTTASRSGSSAAANVAIGSSTGAQVEASGFAGLSKEEQSVVEIDTPVRLILTTQSRTADGHYRWEVKAVHSGPLEGKPWDPLQEPRLSVRDTRTDEKHVEGSCYVEIRCRREDLIIEGIKLKGSSRLNFLPQRKRHHNRMAAAEAYILAALTSRSLGSDDIHEPFGEICLANILVEEAVG
jgi:hypothetical protein